MRRVMSGLLGLAMITACASDGAGQGSTAPTAEPATSTTARAGPGGVSAAHPCDTMVVDPQDFIGESYPELEELGREDTDAGWLRVDGTVGCLVSLTAPGETFRARSVEGYVFDTAQTSASELVAMRVANAISDVTSIEIAGVPGVFGLVGEGADRPYAVAMEADGVGAYVQSNSQEVSVDALIAIARSILEG